MEEMAKSTEQAKANLEASIPLIPERYKRGVMTADWEGPASSDASEMAWGAGVQRAIAAKTRQRKIREVGNAFWQSQASTKGAAAIGEGIRRGLNRYQTNFGRVYQSFLSLVGSLPAKSPDPMANVDARLKPVVRAWRQAAGKES